MRGGRHRPLAAGAVGIAALAVGWLAGGGSTPPLYDSVGTAPPYRFICLPDGIQPKDHPLPADATMTIPVTGGTSPAVEFTSDEQPIPQVQVLVGAGSLALPAGASSITVTAAAMIPPAALPADGALDGNVYTVSITAGGEPATLKAGQPATVVLRGEPLSKVAQMEQFDGTAWHRLDTQPVGTADIFGANVATFTTFALVLPGPAQTHPAAGCQPGTTPRSGATGGGSSSATSSTPAPPDGSSSSATPLVVVAVAALAVALAGGLLLALRRAGEKPPPPPRPRGRGPDGRRR